MKKLLLSAIAAVSFFSAVNAGSSCSRCQHVVKETCQPTPICTKQVVSTVEQPACKTCELVCNYSCPAGYEGTGVASEGYVKDSSANAGDEIISKKAARRFNRN